MNIIMIGTRGGRKACMQTRLDLYDTVNGYIARHHAVELISQLGSVYLRVPIKMSHHGTGMYPGIRTTGAHHLNGFSEQGRQSALQHLLDRQAIGLYLPAMIGCAVKAEIDKITVSHLLCKIIENIRYVQNIST